jgi:uncharacterized protein YbaR (Trm112 family)
MDRKLLDLLVCPTTRQPLQRLDSGALAALNAAAAAGTLRKSDGSAQAQPLREALTTRDRRLAYRLDDGIPVLLAEEAIVTAGIDGFPQA